MIRALVTIACGAVVTGCATHGALTSGTAVYGATLADAPDSATRDMIRTYVRDVIGPDYIADVDALTRSNKLRAVDRGRGQVSGRPIPVPDMTFLLELAETVDGPICRLVPQGEALGAPVLVLPQNVACQLMPATL